jgi:hypothetical protein
LGDNTEQVDSNRKERNASPFDKVDEYLATLKEKSYNCCGPPGIKETDRISFQG